MWFELSVALKYLIPRWRQLSVSIISLVSILVISLVVWLILVFFSVTNGLEKSWTEKIVALTAPVRINPKEEYFKSYYYQIDYLSNASNYTAKTIGEKLAASKTDPFDPQSDEEIPVQIPSPVLNQDGTVKDLVKEVFQSINGIKNVAGLCANDYEMTTCNIKLKASGSSDGPSYINQTTYIGSLELDNPLFKKILLQHISLDKLDDEAIFLPKGYREAGVHLRDQGYITYLAPTTSSVQEQRIPVYVAGFYDPGIMPMGGKYLLANKSVTTQLRSSQQQDDSGITNGINVRFDDISKADAVKNSLMQALHERGLDKYWEIQTFRDYEFTKDLLQQMQSDKVLFLLIAIIIIIVACSNIISMLIILVKDKKKEIGILRSMGASSFSIGVIFGLCGMIMGLIGSMIGFTAAWLTLKNLQGLVNLLSSLQGHNAFNPIYYGDTLPNQMSAEAFLFVALTTGLISLLAGIVPAVKASLMNPSEILRSE